MTSRLATSLQDPPLATRDADGDRFVIDGLSWDQYVAISAALGERVGLHLTFLDGRLELLSPSRAHERHKATIGRLLELWATVSGARLHATGSTNYRDDATERGLEPDECYYVGDAREDAPDIAVEVLLSSGGLPKLEIYGSLGVREVWFWMRVAFEVYALGDDGDYAAIERSTLLPGLDLDALAAHVIIPDQAEAARLWLAALTDGSVPS